MTIKEMLKSGKTPDDLIKEINEAQREIEEDKAKAKEKDTSREFAVDAIMDYLDIITDGEFTEQEYEDMWDEINKTLKEMEEMVHSFKKTGKVNTKKYEFSFDKLDEKDWQKLLKLFV